MARGRPSSTASLVPFVRAEGIRGGTFHARDGFLDPAGLVAALLAEARARGAAIKYSRAAVSWIEPGFVVRHANGHLQADAIVNAAGTGARAVARLLGSDVPVEPVRRNLAHVMDPSPAGGLTPMTVDVDTGVLVRRQPAGGWVHRISDPGDPPGGTRRSIPPSSRRSPPDSPTGSPSIGSVCRWIRHSVGRASTRRRRTTTRSSARTRPYRASSTASGSGAMG